MLAASLEDCKDVADSIAGAVQELDYPVVIAASTDMSHYLPDKTARKKDKMAIDRIIELNPDGLFETVRTEQISMCGYIPTTVMLSAVTVLGAKSARVVKYMTSGEISGDYDSVVGYAGVVIN
jgi:AmmeMemoRadiSam system protein B